MDIKFFEITIRAVVAGITLFILVRYIFFLKLEGFWSFVFPSKKAENKPAAPAAETEPKPQVKQAAAGEAAIVEQPLQAVPSPVNKGQKAGGKSAAVAQETANGGAIAAAAHPTKVEPIPSGTSHKASGELTPAAAQQPKAEQPPKSKPEAKAEGDGIVGESKTVYIDKPVSLKPTPHRSEELERETLPEPEPQPTAEQVEDTLDADIFNYLPEPELDPEEMYFESAMGDIDNGEFSSGATFEQMTNAYDVAMGMEVDDEKIEEAVDTFYAIRGNNFCDFIVSQSERLFAIDKMLKEHVENDGTLIKHLKSRKLSPEVVNFDISRYE